MFKVKFIKLFNRFVNFFSNSGLTISAGRVVQYVAVRFQLIIITE